MENNRKRVVLIGLLGHGKTTLFNRLTGAQEMTAQGGESLTRIIALGQSKAESPEKSFEVLDTPGFGDTKEEMQHIAGILAALKQKEIHRIVIVIRHERIGGMIKHIQPVYKFFKNYKENITFYISYFDQFKGNSNTEKKLIQDRIENEFQIKSFIYNEKQSDASIINQFDQILQKSQQLQVSFSINLIIECFDIFNLDNYENSIEFYKGKFSAKFNTQIQQPIQQFICYFPKQINDPLYLHYLDLLQDFAKQKADEYLQLFINEFGDLMNSQFEVNSNNSQYIPYIKLQYTLNLELSMIMQQINEKKQLHPDFIGNKIKACPYCGLVWVKDYGCNRILCGADAGKYNPSLKFRPFVKFEYKIENKKVILIENDIQLFKNKNELIDKLKDSFNNGQFQQIQQQFNIEQDKELIQLLQKEFDNSCFDQWIQIIDKRNYDEFQSTLAMLLLDSSQKPEDGKKGRFGCGQYFLWENGSSEKNLKKANLLTKQQIQELNDKDLFTISRLENDSEQKNLKKWLNEQDQKLNREIDEQLQKIKLVPQILIKEKQKQKQQQSCTIF